MESTPGPVELSRDAACSKADGFSSKTALNAGLTGLTRATNWEGNMLEMQRHWPAVAKTKNNPTNMVCV